MAISSLAIMAIMVKMAKMATMAWPNVVTDMVINGVYAKEKCRSPMKTKLKKIL